MRRFVFRGVPKVKTSAVAAQLEIRKQAMAIDADFDSDMRSRASDFERAGLVETFESGIVE